MPFNPQSDVIVDVIRAADPEQAAAATRRLSDLASQTGALDAGFDVEMSRVDGRSIRGEFAGIASAHAVSRDGANLNVGSGPAARAQIEFEAMFLDNFLGEMLPKDATSVFGEGTAGEMWKSMLADQVARQVAKSGALGLGSRLFAGRAGEAERALSEGAEMRQRAFAERGLGASPIDGIVVRGRTAS